MPDFEESDLDAKRIRATRCGGRAGSVDFSRLQEGHHGDSLVPVITGLTAWTPFF